VPGISPSNFVDQPAREGGGATATRSGAVASPPSLSNSNNCTKGGQKRLTGQQRKTAFQLAFDVSEMARRHGLEPLLLITLTFDDNHPAGSPHPAFDPKEASRRFHSLATHVLDGRYVCWKRVLERGDLSGRLHYHVVAVGRSDYRTGVDFEAFLTGDYSTRPKALKEEWDFWGNQRRPGAAVEYGFGARVEVMPIRSCGEAIGKYVGKYISKHFGNRRDEDKGIRLVGGSKAASFCSRHFSWNSPRSQLWRRKLDVVAKWYGFTSTKDFGEAFGPHLAYFMASAIMGVDLVKAGGGSYTYAGIEQAMADGRLLPDEIPDVHGPITITSVRLADENPQVVSLVGHPCKIPLQAASSVLGPDEVRKPIPAGIVQAQAERNALIEAGCRRAAAEAVGPDEPIRLEKPVSVNLKAIIIINNIFFHFYARYLPVNICPPRLSFFSFYPNRDFVNISINPNPPICPRKSNAFYSRLLFINRSPESKRIT